MTASASTPARAGRGSADGQVLGVLLIASGVGWLLQRSGVVHFSWETLLSLLLVLLGVGMLMTARRPGGMGLVVIGAAMTIALASTSSIDAGLLKEGVGDRKLTPENIDAAREDSRLAVGHLDVDLAGVDWTTEGPGPHTLRYEVGVGELTVRVPKDATVRVIGKARGGELSLLGVERTGPQIEEEVMQPDKTWPADKPGLVLYVSVWFGAVNVERATG